MREEHRQKVLLSVVGLLSLGMGSYWFFGKSDHAPATLDGVVQRHAAATKPSKPPDRQPRPATPKAIATPERRHAPIVDSAKPERHRPKRNDREVRKIEVKPAC